MASLVSKHVLEPCEKVLIVNVHDYFIREKDERRAGTHRPVRQRVAACLGFSEATIARVMADWNRHHDATFPPRDRQGLPLAAGVTATRGHAPRRIDEQQYAPLIREIIQAKHAQSMPVTAAIVQNEFQEYICMTMNTTLNIYVFHRRSSIQISVRSMRRVLRRLGYRYLKGQNRNILAESPANVAFRAQYIQAKLDNRDANGFPMVPEVFLDESFCNLHHVAARSWLDASRVRYGPSGKGDRYCIIGAGKLVTA